MLGICRYLHIVGTAIMILCAPELHLLLLVNLIMPLNRKPLPDYGK